MLPLCRELKKITYNIKDLKFVRMLMRSFPHSNCLKQSVDST